MISYYPLSKTEIMHTLRDIKKSSHIADKDVGYIVQINVADDSEWGSTIWTRPYEEVESEWAVSTLAEFSLTHTIHEIIFKYPYGFMLTLEKSQDGKTNIDAKIIDYIGKMVKYIRKNKGS